MMIEKLILKNFQKLFQLWKDGELKEMQKNYLNKLIQMDMDLYYLINLLHGLLRKILI